VRRERERNAGSSLAAGGAQLFDRAPVPEQHVVERRALAANVVLDPGRVESVEVTEQTDDPRLVDRAPPAHAVAVGVEARARVLGEALGRVARQPAAFVLECLRQVPVVQRDDGVDAALE
jgi:hypothetical protein